MKNIKESLHDIIFRSIVMESKASYDKFDMTFDEFCSDKANLELKDKEVTELHGFKEVLNNDAVVIATQSFKEGFNWAMDYKDSSEYQNIFIVLPFNELNIVIKLQKRNGEHKNISIFVVGPKDVNIKSCVNNSKGAYKYYKSIYLNSDDKDEEIFEEVFNALNKLKDSVGNAFSSESKAIASTPTPDKSPYTLTKKKKFPDYVRHCYVKAQGKDFIYKNTWDGEADIFVQTVTLDKKKYYAVLMGDAEGALQDGNEGDNIMTYYLTTLGQLDKFLEFTLKPNKMKKHSELGEDGEIHVWHTKMQKNLPANLKKDIIKDEEIIKKCKFHNMNIFDLYKGK